MFINSKLAKLVHEDDGCKPNNDKKMIVDVCSVESLVSPKSSASLSDIQSSASSDYDVSCGGTDATHSLSQLCDVPDIELLTCGPAQANGSYKKLKIPRQPSQHGSFLAVTDPVTVATRSSDVWWYQALAKPSATKLPSVRAPLMKVSHTGCTRSDHQHCDHRNKSGKLYRGWICWKSGMVSWMTVENKASYGTPGAI